MAMEIMDYLGLNNRGIPTVLELVDQCTIQLVGVLDDIVISIDSPEYPTNFMLL